MRNRALLWLLVVALLLPLAAFIRLVEFYPEEQDLGWTLRAWLNPLLAAEQFLTRVGEPVRSAGRLSMNEAFPPGGTVYLSNVTQVLTERQGERILRWIEDGGHLIVIAQVVHDDNYLLDHLSVEVEHPDCGCEAEHEASGEEGGEGARENGEQHSDTVAENADSEEGSAEEEPLTLSESLRQYNAELREMLASEGEFREEQDPAALTRLAFEDVEGELIADFGTRVVLDHPSLYEWREEDLQEGETVPDWHYEPLYVAGSESGQHFMQFAIEEGLLSVIAGDSPFVNGSIGDHDHAYLLWLLTAGSSETLLLYGMEYPDLASVIWDNWPETVISALLLLAALLWFHGRRFGPVLEAPGFSRRGIDEHLRSSGQYHWRYRQTAALLDPLIADIGERAARLYPQFATQSRARRLAILADASELSAETIAEALYGDVPRNTTDFTRRVRTLQQLRETL